MKAKSRTVFAVFANFATSTFHFEQLKLAFITSTLLSNVVLMFVICISIFTFGRAKFLLSANKFDITSGTFFIHKVF